MPSLVELRVLEGPNLYFPRAAIKLTLDVDGLSGTSAETAKRFAERIGLPSARPGEPGSGFRQRFVLRAVARLVRAVAQESGTQRLAVRVRPPAVAPDIYNRAAAPGPAVLQVSPDVIVGPLPAGPTGLVAIRAVPVAAVTNGAAFGPTGYGYYNDSLSEGPLNRPHRMADYVLGSRAY